MDDQSFAAKRYPWPCPFPDVAIHATETAVKQHAAYRAAKGGDIEAAKQLVADTLNDNILCHMADCCAGLAPRLIAVHALERIGVNAIPATLAFMLSARFGWDVELEVIQANVVNHTGASGFARLARQAIFDGNITPGNFVIVDDFIGQGGTTPICAVISLGRAETSFMLLC